MTEKKNPWCASQSWVEDQGFVSCVRGDHDDKAPHHDGRGNSWTGAQPSPNRLRCTAVSGDDPDDVSFFGIPGIPCSLLSHDVDIMHDSGRGTRWLTKGEMDEVLRRREERALSAAKGDPSARASTQSEEKAAARDLPDDTDDPILYAKNSEEAQRMTGRFRALRAERDAVPDQATAALLHTPLDELPDPVTARVENDSVHHPSHYTAYKGIEVIDLTKQMDFLRGNVVKYVARAKFKGSELEDLRKAQQYLTWAIEELEGRDEQ